MEVCQFLLDLLESVIVVFYYVKATYAIYLFK